MVSFNTKINAKENCNHPQNLYNIDILQIKELR